MTATLLRPGEPIGVAPGLLGRIGPAPFVLVDLFAAASLVAGAITIG